MTDDADDTEELAARAVSTAEGDVFLSGNEVREIRNDPVLTVAEVARHRAESGKHRLPFAGDDDGGAEA